MAAGPSSCLAVENSRSFDGCSLLIREFWKANDERDARFFRPALAAGAEISVETFRKRFSKFLRNVVLPAPESTVRLVSNLSMRSVWDEEGDRSMRNSCVTCNMSLRIT